MKTLTKAVIGIVVVALVATAVVMVRNYYIDRYVGSDYYAQIPLDYNVTPRAISGMNGVDMGLGVDFVLTAYNEAGQSKTVEFNVYDPSSDFNHGEVIPQPGTYLKVEASNQVVNGWSVIEKSKIPEGALAKIESR